VACNPQEKFQKLANVLPELPRVNSDDAHSDDAHSNDAHLSMMRTSDDARGSSA